MGPEMRIARGLVGRGNRLKRGGLPSQLTVSGSGNSMSQFLGGARRILVFGEFI